MISEEQKFFKRYKIKANILSNINFSNREHV